MGKNNVTPEYSLRLRENFASFTRDFNEEFKKQETKENKSSERRMRVLLRSFYERVYRPYKEETLQFKQVGLKDILEEGES